MAVSAVDRLDMEGVPDPFAAGRIQCLVTDTRRGGAGRVCAVAVAYKDDVPVHDRSDHLPHGVGVDRRKNRADRRAAAVGGHQDRDLFPRPAGLACLASPTARPGRSHANSCRFFLTGRFFGECRRHMPLHPAGRTRIRRVCVHYRYMWITSDTIYLMETSRNLPGGKAPGARVPVRFREMIRPFRTGGNGEGSRNSGQDHGITLGDTESVLFPPSVGSS